MPSRDVNKHHPRDAMPGYTPPFRPGVHERWSNEPELRITVIPRKRKEPARCYEEASTHRILSVSAETGESVAFPEIVGFPPCEIASKELRIQVVDVRRWNDGAGFDEWAGHAIAVDEPREGAEVD
jgi:hypothetical protein